LLALVAQYELDLDQHDMKTTFLYGDLDEEIYVSVDGVQNCRQGEYGWQAEEIAIWIETIS